MEEQLKFNKNMVRFMEITQKAIDNLLKAVRATNERIDLLERRVKNGNSN